MTTDERTQESNKNWGFANGVTDRWVNAITYAITGAVTSVVATVITAITIVVVVLGGLWLAYTYLPLNVFTIIAVVLAADILIGIGLRAYMKRRQ